MQSSCLQLNMDPPHVLQQAKKEITESTEWERVVQELCSLLEQISGRQHLSFEGLSEQEQHKLMRQAAGQLQRTNTFKDLQTKISSTLALTDVIPSLVLLQHFDDESQSAGMRNESLILKTPSSKLGSEHTEKACAYLLQEHHHLKHYLKKCFNHPLPAELRRAAWKALLLFDPTAVRRGNLPKSRRFSVTTFKEEVIEDREIIRRCEVTVRSSPFFSRLARSPMIMEAMKSIMASWSRYKGNRQHDSQPSDTEFLLCIPFLYTWQSKLEREEGAPRIGTRPHAEQLQTSLTQVYVSFMEDAHMKVMKALDQTALEVEDLLSAESPTLHKHLVKILGSKFKVDRDAHSQHRAQLKKIICIHLQRMFVGISLFEIFTTNILY